MNEEGLNREETYVFFSTTEGIASTFLRKVLRRPFSHCGFLFWDNEWEAWFCLEATGKGSRSVSLLNFRQRNRLIAVLLPRANISRALRKVAVEKLGEASYAWGGLVGMALVKLMSWAGRKLLNPFRSSYSVFCSQIVMWILQRSGELGTETLDPYSTDPDQVFRALGGWSRNLLPKT